MRVEDWQNKLAAYVRDVAFKFEEMKFGALDCALFTARGAEVITGKDILSPVVGKYTSYVEGVKLVRSMGFNDHVEYFASHFEELPSPLMATRGDAVSFDDKHGTPALGIVQGEQIYCLGEDGLKLISLLNAKRAFRV